ncbi:MAG: HYR domain-containing protein, partial [Flavobacteriales bacterium]
MAVTLRLQEGRMRFAPFIIVALLAWPFGQSRAQGPVWNWARTMDAGSTEYVRDIAVEPATGNIYVAGAYQSSAATVVPFGLPATVNGSVDAFLAKLDPNGNLLWSRNIGSNQDDAANGIAVAPSGNVVVTGYYRGAIAGLNLTNLGTADAFIAAYDGNGAFQWSRRIAGPQWDEGTGITVAGNVIVAYGSFSHHSTISGVLATLGLTTGRIYSYLNAYELSGTALWSLTGVSNDNILPESIAADATHVFVVGSTAGASMAWQNSSGISLTSATTTNSNALYCSSVALNGVPAWLRMINNPGDANARCSGVEVDCGAVYITGHTHNGSVFPGGNAPSMPGAHDYWYLAALSRSTGTTNWIRTATSTVDHGVTGHDITAGRNGQLIVAGMMQGTVTTDGGTVISGASNEDIAISRFNRDGSAIWFRRESAGGDERALAMGSSGNGTLIIGGRYSNDLTLGTATYAGSSGTNLYAASFTDSEWQNVANSPARFARPGPICSGSGAVNLNSFLASFAGTVTASSNVASQQDALGAPDAMGAAFNATNGWLVLDLIDTLSISEALRFTWRSESTSQARMLISSSLDGVNWSTATTISTTSTSFINSNYTLPVNARYIRIARHSSALYAAFHLDAVRLQLTTLTGGTWSGGAHVTSAGIFTPGLAGNYPVTYTVIAGSCTYSHSRSILVTPAPGGGSIAGGVTACPNSTGSLTLSGHAGSIVRWQWTDDGATWINTAETSPTFIWSGLSAPRRFRVELSSPACANGFSDVTQVTPEDTQPPLLICPAPSPAISVDADGDCNLVVPDFTGLFVPTDNCPGVIAIAQTPAAGDVIPFANLTIVLVRAIDVSGNTSNVCEARLIGVDSTPPVASCPPDTTITVTTGTCIAEYTPPPATYSDNCMGSGTAERAYLRNGIQVVPQFSVFNPSGWLNVTGETSIGLPPGTYTLVNVIHHLSDVIAMCSHVITVVDFEPPVASCPPPYTLLYALPNDCHATYTVPAIPSTDNCSGSGISAGPVLNGGTAIIVSGGTTVIVQPDDALPAGMELLLPIGIHEFIDSISDVSGNLTICTWLVEVRDSTPPVFDNCPANSTLGTDANSCTRLYTFPTIESTDNCDPDTESDYRTWHSTNNGGSWSEVTGQNDILLAVGVHLFKEKHRDDSGNTADCDWSVTIEDQEAPSITCPNIVAQLSVGANCTVALPDYRSSATASDNCGPVILSQSPAPGTIVGPGPHSITITATANGLFPSCSFTVTAVDQTNPVIVCPSDIAVEAQPGLCGAVVTYPLPTATDNCGPVTVTLAAGLVSGSVFPVGTTVVRYRAADNVVPPNTRECFFWVTVFDATAPTLTTCSNITDTASATSCDTIVNYTAPVASEPCTTCPTGAIPVGYSMLGTYQGRTYFYRNSTSTWQAANYAAISAGGHLVVIRDAAHNDWLRSAVDAIGGTNQSFWIGLNDIATE